MSNKKSPYKKFIEYFKGGSKKTKYKNTVNMTPVELVIKTIKTLKEAQDKINKGLHAFDVESPVCVFQAMKKILPGNVFEGPLQEVVEGESNPFVNYCFVVASSKEEFDKHEQRR